MIPAMIHDGNAAEQLPAVEAHVQRAVLLATAIARCDWLAEGPTEASNWLRQADKRLRSVLNELRDTYLKNYDFIEHLAKDEGPVKAFFDRSRSLLGVLESHAAQINHAAILKLPAPSDWDKYLLEQAKKSDVLFISSIPMSEEQD
jgi:hypothetical protein